MHETRVVIPYSEPTPEISRAAILDLDISRYPEHSLHHRYGAQIYYARGIIFKEVAISMAVGHLMSGISLHKNPFPKLMFSNPEICETADNKIPKIGIFFRAFEGDSGLKLEELVEQSEQFIQVTNGALQTLGSKLNIPA